MHIGELHQGGSAIPYILQDIFGYFLLHRLIFLMLGHYELFSNGGKLFLFMCLCFFGLFVCLFDGFFSRLFSPIDFSLFSLSQEFL